MGPLHGHGEELIFQYPPLAVDFDHNAYVVTDDAQELLTPAQAYALKISDRANWAFLAYTARIQDVWHLLRSEIHASEKKDVLQSFLLQELARLDQYKGKKWEQLRYAAINGRHYFITGLSVPLLCFVRCSLSFQTNIFGHHDFAIQLSQWQL